MANETFKAKVSFGAKIGIIAKAKVKIVAKAKVGKFSIVSRGANSNIEGLDINNPVADLIALIGLTILPGLILSGRKVIVIAIRFSYFFISF